MIGVGFKMGELVARGYRDDLFLANALWSEELVAKGAFSDYARSHLLVGHAPCFRRQIIHLLFPLRRRLYGQEVFTRVRERWVTRIVK